MRVRFPALLTAPLLLLLLAASACSPPREAQGPQRIGVPPELEKVLAFGPHAGLGPATFVTLRPYDRARDLEVLLFASRSPAFAGMVVPGRWVGMLAPWTRPLPAEWLKGVRPDLAASLATKDGVLALPLTLDGPVLLYRRDLWSSMGLPQPDTLAGLRDALLQIASLHPDLDAPVASDLPEDQLFWALAWSYEGSDSPNLYSYPKVHALRFMQEFSLADRSGEAEPGSALMREGRAAVLFCTGHEAEGLLKAAQAPSRYAVAPLPAASGQAHCIFDGWCLTRPAGGLADPSTWRTLLSEPFQTYLRKKGWQPVLASANGQRGGPVFTAFQHTRFHAPPALGPQGDEIVMGAIQDALAGPMAPEEALRRAEARLRAKGAK